MLALALVLAATAVRGFTPLPIVQAPWRTTARALRRAPSPRATAGASGHRESTTSAEPASSAAVLAVADGRTFRVCADADALSAALAARVAALAAAAIAERGAFCLSIGSGTTVAPLATLAGQAGADFSKWHVFFGNERTTGDTAFKCFRGAAAFTAACGVPPSQVHCVPGGDDPAASAAAYQATVRAALQDLAPSRRSDLPPLDLVLLGSGDDGHCASLYPGSAQLLAPAQQAWCEAAGKGGVTITLEAIQAARCVLVSAGKESQATMVAAALGSADEAHGLPVGLIRATPGRTQVEWLLTAASAAQLLPLLGPAARAGAEPAEAGELASGLGTTMDALLAAEIAQQAELREALDVLDAQSSLAAELGYGSAAELMAAMDEIEASDGGLEAFLATLENGGGETGGGEDGEVEKGAEAAAEGTHRH